MNEQTINLVKDFAEQLKAQIIEVSPKVLDVATLIVRVNSVQEFMAGFGFLILLVISLTIGIKCQRKVIEINDDIDSFGYQMAMILGFVFGAAFLIMMLTRFLNIWNYIGVSNPELKLAYDIYKSIFQ